ncbi:hypothetical protein PoB_006288600 [Plakobranchus ocellatus]|uniref:Uncharacterized protein n=1 Tax=Plakobranchus ocellatus TaxID=259542 RepID=A0AAV4CWY9_9GAST|nr:hypothetical protein PoB_006288600 [Plakobranchus ocellatus]
MISARRVSAYRYPFQTSMMCAGWLIVYHLPPVLALHKLFKYRILDRHIVTQLYYYDEAKPNNDNSNVNNSRKDSNNSNNKSNNNSDENCNNSSNSSSSSNNSRSNNSNNEEITATMKK